MKIVNNNDSANCHFNTLVDLVKHAEELLIVSPFVSSNFNIIPKQNLQGIKKLTLLTTLPQICGEQEKKVGFFLHYLGLASKYGFALTILIDDSLHGKVYIGKSGSTCQAIITSANFTRNGLYVNNEWGIYLDDSKVISGIWQTILSSPQIYELTPSKVHEYDQIIKSHKIAQPKKPTQSYDFRPPVPSVISTAAKNFTCWLKPIGTSDHPIPDTELHDTPLRDITFAERPIGIRRGDIVICYAALRKFIVSVYVVEQEWFKNGNSDFPYSVVGRNLYPYYGAEWPKMNITIDTIKSKVIANKQFTITPKGANNYVRLTRADKMKVTREYAEFVMREIEAENSKIASQKVTD